MTDIEAIRERHGPLQVTELAFICEGCEAIWPCDAFVLLGEVDQRTPPQTFDGWTVEVVYLNNGRRYTGRQTFTATLAESLRSGEEHVISLAARQLTQDIVRMRSER